MKTNFKNKKVITIIVMIILAAAIIISLNNANVINSANKAVSDTDLKQVQTMASLAWSDAFTKNEKTQTELQTAVMNAMTENKVDTSKYFIRVTTKGVDVYAMPDSVVAVVDGVPIPKGFVASDATGENTKDGGLVIYEGTEAVTDANVVTAKTARNQFVWVPVDDFAKFKRTAYTINSSTQTLSNILGDMIWEVSPTSDINYTGTVTNPSYQICVDEKWYGSGEEGKADCLAEYPPISVISVNMVTSTTMAEVTAMYASVKKYGGFYVARYEMGTDTVRSSSAAGITATAYSMQNKYVYNNIGWSNSEEMTNEAGGAVELARRMYKADETNTTGVVSTLMYGVQWDTTCNWLLSSGTVTSLTDSTAYGNYRNHAIAVGDLNEGAKYSISYSSSSVSYPTQTTAKNTSTGWLLTTGALKAAKTNNIYDMAGNLWEWTMEGTSTYYRVDRGGGFSNSGSVDPASYRLSVDPSNSGFSFGARPSLYIK